MENNKKILIPTIVAVATLVLLVFGATYAYFTVGSTNNFGTKELNATLEDMADAVVLEQLENELSLDVTRVQMSEANAGTTYYASGSSIPTNIAKISTTGEGIFKCTYKITITKSASSEENDLYKNIIYHGYENTAYLQVNMFEYQFYDPHYCSEGCANDECTEFMYFCEELPSEFPITYNGSTYGITKDSPQYITTNLAIKNKNYNQSALKGNDITLTYNISNFECNLDTEEYTELSFDSVKYMNYLGYEQFAYYDTIVIPSLFSGNNEIYKVKSISSIGDDFYFNTLVLPDTLITIEDYAFSHERGVISISNIVVPTSVTHIGYGAFDYFSGTIKYRGTEEQWDDIEKDYIGEDFEIEFNYTGN